MKFGIRLVQRWWTGHNHSKIMKFRALPFRGGELDMTVKRGNLAVSQFRGDWLDMTYWDVTKVRILPFIGLLLTWQGLPCDFKWACHSMEENDKWSLDLLRKIRIFSWRCWFYPSGNMSESHYQRFSANKIGLTCDHFAEEMNIVLCGPTIPWTGISKQFWRGIKWDHVP